MLIDKNKRRWFVHVMGGDNAEGCNEVKDEGKETEGKTNTKVVLDNINNHLKRKNTSPKEVIEKKCFENRQDWRTLIFLSTDMSYGEDH